MAPASPSRTEAAGRGRVARRSLVVGLGVGVLGAIQRWAAPVTGAGVAPERFAATAAGALFGTAAMAADALFGTAATTADALFGTAAMAAGAPFESATVAFGVLFESAELSAIVTALAVLGPMGLAATTDGSDVEALTERVQRVAEGEYDVAFDLDRDDELGELADALDTMTDEVADREAALEREIDFTEEVLDEIDDVFYVLDRDGEHRQWNRTLEEVSGYDADEVAELHPLDYFEGEDREAVAAGIDRAFEEGHARAEAALQTKDGESIPYEWIANRLEAPDGTPVVAGIGRDVSARKARERELQRNERRFEAVFNDPNLLAGILAPDGTLIDANDHAMERVDADRAELLGEPFWETPWWTGDEALQTEIREGIERAAAGEYVDYDVHHQGPQTEEYVSSGTIRPVFDDDGEVSSLIVSAHDVTERRERETELRERERALQRYKTYTDEILDSIDDVFYVVGSDFSMQRWNRSMREATGYDDEEIAEMHPIEFVVEEDQAAIADAVAETFETGSARTEARIRTKDGESIPYEFIGSLLEDPGGNPVLVGVGRDVSERVQRERELQRTRYLLKQAQEIAQVGGWELDVREGPYSFEATDAFYAIHDIPQDEPIGPEDIIEYYHPEDRERIERLMAEAIEEGVSYDMEVRLAPSAVGDRWIRAIAEPVVEDGEVVALRGSVQDITDRKENELRLQALHDVARGLLEAESQAEIADLVVDAATTVLGPPCIGVYLFDEDTGRLEPAATSERFDAVCGDADVGYAAAEGELLWEAYVGGEAVEATGDALEDAAVTDEAGSALVVPIGEHGVLLAATDCPNVARDDRRVAETLVATMEAALSQLESAAALRENQRQLEAQNRRLRRQIQITEIIRRVDRSLVGASTREEIESAVCERLAESEDVAFAWIGALDEADRSLEPRVWAGEGHEYLDAVSLSADASAPDPALRAAIDSESVVVRSVVDEVTTEEWRKHALVWDFSSVIAVPLELEEYSYGVLAVYATDPGTFGDLERNVFEELGESIANAINALEARRALYADEFVELRLELADEEEFLGRVAAAAGATVEYVGLATHTDDESRLFFQVDDADPAAVREVLEELHAVREYRQIGDVDGGRTLFEATVAGTVLAARLVERGGVPRSMVADGGELEVVVDVPVATDVREFVEMLRERYPSVELLARQDVTRDVQTRQELVAGLFDGLTERQLEVLRTAFFAGFFEWPRESTGEEVAELLDVSQPTVNRHLRHGLARLLEQLFEEESTAVAPT